MEKKITRKELYDLVWSSPLTSLSKQYGMSDNGLRKVCIRMKIPLPKAGHWQRVRHGKRGTAIALPTDYTGENEVALGMTEEKGAINPITDQINQLKLEIEAELQGTLVVPERLTKPDPLITATKERFAASLKGDWSSKIYQIYPTQLSISALASLHPRALRIFDTIIKVLRARNHEVKVEYQETKAIVFGEEMEIRIKEKNKMIKEIKEHWSSTRREPTGVLYFAAKINWNEKIWLDGVVPLEQQLSRIVAYLEIKGQQLKEERIIREIEHKKEEEKRLLKKEFENKQDRELNDFKLLLKKVERWQQIKLMRGYIDELESKSIERNLFTEDIKSWIGWARKKTDWYDPHVNGSDELFENLNKEALTFSGRGYW